MEWGIACQPNVAAQAETDKKKGKWGMMVMKRKMPESHHEADTRGSHSSNMCLRTDIRVILLLHSENKLFSPTCC